MNFNQSANALRLGRLVGDYKRSRAHVVELIVSLKIIFP